MESINIGVINDRITRVYLKDGKKADTFEGKVLVVDDDEDILNLFRVVEKKLNLTLVMAHDGMEAVTKFKNQDFDMVITDLKMPRMNGIKFIQQIRKIPGRENFPFVVMTGNLKEYKPEMALLHKIEIMEKPVPLKKLEQFFLKKLGPPLVQFGSLSEETISSKLCETFDQKVTPLLEIITRHPVISKELEERPGLTSIHEGNMVQLPLNIWGNEFLLSFTFDPNFSRMIAHAFFKLENFSIEQELKALQHFAHVLSDKVLDELHFDNDQAQKGVMSAVGNVHHTLLFNGLECKDSIGIQLKNPKGSLSINIMY